MESPQPISPHPPFGSAASSRSRSSSKLDDVTSLTSFNPFEEEDEHARQVRNENTYRLQWDELFGMLAAYSGIKEAGYQ